MAPQLNHVSVIATDLAASMRFYVDELGLEPLPTPDFGFPVVWLRAEDCQVHLFERPGEPPSHAHFGLEISEFMPVYRRMK
ncbi:MAG: VOC family protein, partial [Gaiellaceae bacterium]